MSYGLYVGKNLTADGVALIGGYGDEPSSHWLEVIPAAEHPPGATLRVGVTLEAEMPGRLSDIPQARRTFRHLRVSYSHYKGVPAPLANGGLNEHGVAVRDIWSPSRPELVAMTPSDQTGPNYSDLAKIVLERARTARQGVELIGQLIADHGYSDYGGNSHMIADADEAWVIIEMSGGQKLWVAERVGPSGIRASRPGHIGDIPQTSGGDVLFPDHFISFAIARGWHDPAAGPFNVNRVYGDGKGVWAGVRFIEAEMAARAQVGKGITLSDMMWAIRTPELTGDTAGYGQIVPLHGAMPASLRMLWHAPVGASAAPFMPVWLGIESIPPEYRQHRYLTDGEAARFLDMRHATNGRPDSLSIVPQGIEASRSAVMEAKRLFYLALRGQGRQRLDRLIAIFSAFEADLARQAARMQEIATLLVEAGRPDLADHQLGFFSHACLDRGLALVTKLADGLDAEIRAEALFDSVEVPRSPDQIW